MDSFELTADQATAVYDPETRIVTIRYKGDLDAAITIQVYDWLDRLYHEVGLETIYGQIFDFRNVTRFDPTNLTTARRTSAKMNMAQDTSQFPVALIVANREQEETLRGPMRIPEGHQRKRIVWSDEDALAFINNWYNSAE